MEVAIFVVILFFVTFVPWMLFGPEWQAAEERARARRMVEHRRNARLLRLDI